MNKYLKITLGVVLGIAATVVCLLAMMPNDASELYDASEASFEREASYYCDHYTVYDPKDDAVPRTWKAIIQGAENPKLCGTAELRKIVKKDVRAEKFVYIDFDERVIMYATSDRWYYWKGEE